MYALVNQGGFVVRYIYLRCKGLYMPLSTEGMNRKLFIWLNAKYDFLSQIPFTSKLDMVF